MEIIFEQIALWSPTIASVLGIVISVILTCYKVIKVINDFKERNKAEIQTLIENDKQVKTELEEVIADNRELKKRINILVDQLTKIDNYVEAKLNEQQNNQE